MNHPLNHKQLTNFAPSMGSHKNTMLAALDIGTSKVSCFIAQPMSQAMSSPTQPQSKPAAPNRQKKSQTNSQTDSPRDLFSDLSDEAHIDTPQNPQLNIQANIQSNIQADSKSPVMQIKGVGHHASHGLKAGMVVDMAAAEKSIRATVEAAERMADMVIENVIAGISSTHLESHTYTISLPLKGQAVGDDQLGEALCQARDKCISDKVELLHAIPIRYQIDDSVNLTDPRGMYGDQLHITAHAITIPASPVRNLLACIEQCHLRVEKLVAAPYASAFACMVEDEMELGALVIDMGGGTTSFTLFYEGAPIYTATLPIGGQHVTLDIARGLNIPLAQAERIKRLHGSALSSAHEQQDQFDVLPIGETGEAGMQTIQRSMLTTIIRPRIEEIFEMVREKLKAANLHNFIGHQIVLTGGGALLSGARELAELILEKQTRIGYPLKLASLPTATEGPAFSATAGLLAYAQRTQNTALSPRPSPFFAMGRISQWLKRNF